MARRPVGAGAGLPKLQVTDKLSKVTIRVTGKDVRAVARNFAVWLDPVKADLNFGYWEKRTSIFGMLDRPIEAEDFLKLFPSDFSDSFAVLQERAAT